MELLIILVVIIATLSISRKIDRLEQKIDVLGTAEQNTEKTQSAAAEKSTHDTNQELYFEDKSVQKQESHAEILKAEAGNVLPQKVSPVEAHATAVKYFEEKEISSAEVDENELIERVWTWISTDWPLKIGGLLVVLSVAWFVTFAAEQGWLSETARVVLGYVFGTAMLALGVLRSEKEALQGYVFIVIGVASIFIATLAAVSFKSVLMPVSVALFVMFAVVMCVALISLKQNRVSLTGSMFFFGGLVPLFFIDDIDKQTLFLYLLSITAGSLWIVARTGWRAMTLLALMIVSFYSIILAIDENLFVDRGWLGVELIVAMVFAGVFYAASTAAVLRTRTLTPVDIAVAVILGVMYTAWTWWFAPSYAHPYLLLIGALLFTIGAYLMHESSRNRLPMILYGMISVALLVIAAALQFEGPMQTLAFLALYGAVASLLIFTAPQQRGVQSSADGSLILGLIAVTLAALPDLASIIIDGRYGVDNPGLVIFMVLTWLILMLTLAYGAYQKGLENLVKVYGVAGLLLGVHLVWTVPHLIFNSFDVGTMVSLMIYALLGSLFYIYGALDRQDTLQKIGIFFFVIVLGRIFLVEFWQMTMAVRIVTFFVIGGIFIASTFVTAHYRK